MIASPMLRMLLLWLLLCLLPFNSPYAADNDMIAVIVPADFSTKHLSRTELSLIFLRKKLYWPNGKRIRPANLPTQQALRKQFSQHVLGSLPQAQNEYWNELYFHGTSPPYVVNSQEAMLRFVADTAGSIGYIDACLLDERVKAIAWLQTDGSLSYIQPAFICPQNPP
jgi:ABC-type phosphate transport system substrate-binding protein